MSQIKLLGFKGRVHCFSMQVVINTCKKLKKIGANSSCRFQAKRTIEFQKMTSPSRRL